MATEREVPNSALGRDSSARLVLYYGVVGGQGRDRAAVSNAQSMLSPPLCIRPGVVEDAPALAAFAARTFAESFGADNQPDDLRAHLQASYGVHQQSRELEDPNVSTLLAHRADTLVAYAQVRLHKPPSCVASNDPVQLLRFYVDRPAQGQGVAQRLMTAVYQAACRLGGQHLWLTAWERNPRALAFYRKVGFVDVGATEFLVGTDRQRDRVLVTKIVTDGSAP